MGREIIRYVLDNEKEMLALCPSGGSSVQPIKNSVTWGQDAGELVSIQECRKCLFRESCVAEMYYTGQRG